MEGTAGGRAEASNTRTELTEANAHIMEGELHDCCCSTLALWSVLARAVIPQLGLIQMCTSGAALEMHYYAQPSYSRAQRCC
jgi:hypothetical protein